MARAVANCALPVCYVAPEGGTSPAWCAAFAAGCGGTIADGTQIEDAPAALFGSPKLWPLLQEVRRQGRDWYYGDHAFFRRFEYYRAARNAFQISGDGQASSSRFDALGIPIQPWQRNGCHILICPPDEVFAGLMGFGAKNWLDDVLGLLPQHTDRPIHIRARLGPERPNRPLSVDLNDCWALVTYTSNAAVEAALAGIPIFCTGDCAALTMGSSDLSQIEAPRYPDDRHRWASVLADNQWTLEEMESGMCWKAIGR